ncbi:phosphatidic acid phosphatase type 2/haloperoxidase [Lentinula aciculospora]|uniref:Phosphatidic acid phosphatase type 2/haloperoxidase n=1 Tax=Lentinula aciculospora TaxID=153920 RepID=A0A9W9DTD8_9AGAR|nr:phosphatidic acid phosphatase type 2/haloperoxidase [Lentinula aciculospora]
MFSHRRERKLPVSATRRRKLLFSYAPDCALFFLLDRIHGFWRDFSLDDTSLRHPYAVHERIELVLYQTFALVLICFVAPLLIQPVINFLSIRSWWDLHNFILSLAMAGVVTQFTKVTVGRPRPGINTLFFLPLSFLILPYIDVIDRCQPIPGSEDPTFGLSTAAICTQTDMSLLKDGFRSFPSGHSSLSFAGLGFLAFYVAGKLHLFDHKGHIAKVWLFLAPFSGAALVAISRTMDYRHHWQDVLVGSILGTVMAYFSYRQYYPSLSSELCHRPYSPRIAREPEVLPLHHRHQNSETSALPPRTNAPEGTVPRPDPGSLTELWGNGARFETSEYRSESQSD